MPDDVFQFDNADESPGFSLWQVSSMWQRQINAGLKPFDLTHAQFVLLASMTWLAGGEKPLTQIDLASHAKMDVMMTSNVLRTLEEKGLILRKPHPTDTRAKALSITAQGRKLAIQAIEVVEKIDHEFFKGLRGNSKKFNEYLLALIAANQPTG
ncbi:MAG: MarR family transcriptional regulator [Anaerolineales bacterium]|jgi:DNA-binding MarR family transcriptional regulator|uniref:MarR family winged helix-turn-helix transcriptional regulator n=1 Tax=Candidatus Villigracilis vicinus TaxID=3140679 RepID=UPI0031363BFA|nr:MarR family transcriptional regulator [Anaerolineales bacterium]MBK9780964.1 MarR family transcriptional regulator [Anaerolineales bacterium]